MPRGGDIRLGQVGVHFQIHLGLERHRLCLAALVENCLLEQTDIEVIADRFDMPVLARTEQIPCAANLHIAEGDAEARAEFGIFAERLQPLA